jgi:di/tricarboxylate transporter
VSWEAWLTLAVVVAVITALGTERISPPVAIVGGVTLLLVAGVIDEEEALSGFSNPAPASVAALYVLAAGVGVTGALDAVTGRILAGVPPGPSGDRSALLRMLYPTAASSAFLNNTPIVAMVAPGVMSWARRSGRSASAFLMPLSFAAILGGTMTLIGTSTNLVVSGLMRESGQEPMGLFEIGRVGLPLAIVGVALVSLLAFKLLPHRRTPGDDFADAREFTVEMVVTEGSRLAGKSVAEGQLRSLEGVFLVEIQRAAHRIAPVSPDEVIVEGDRLTFAGNVDRVLDLQKMTGLRSAEEPHFSVAGTTHARRLYEAVVAEGGGLTGTTLKEVGFRARYGGAVLAIHRAGERVPGKLGEVVLRPGDVLLVLGPPGFRRRWIDQGDFLLVASLDGDTPPRKEKAPIVGAVTAALLLTVGSGALDILEGALLAAFALVVTGVLSANEARRAVDLSVIVVIAGSFGLGAAIGVSGLADEIARILIEPFSAFGDVGLLVGVVITTMVLTELITNNAAAVLMFPIALAAASQAGLDPRGFAFAIAIGASASFLTPIGYQTNTMVYGMGGYHFSDFVRLGLPLSVMVIVVSALLIPQAWPLS